MLIDMVGKGTDMTLAVFSAHSTLTTLKESEALSEDGGKYRQRTQKTGARRGGTQKPRACTAGIEATNIGTLASVTVY